MKSTKRVRNYKRNLRKSRKKMRKSRKMKGGAASLNPSMWAIELDEGKKNYSEADSLRLTEEYLKQNFQRETTMRGQKYIINLLDLTQTNLKTQYSRKLLLPNDDRFKWSVKTKTGTQLYDLETSHELTKIYVDTKKKTDEEKTYIYSTGGYLYAINVVNLTQTNLTTDTVRKVTPPEFLSGGGGASANVVGTIPGPSLVGVNTKRPGGGSAASKSKRPGGGSGASSSKRPGGGSGASSIPVKLGNGSYDPSIDALKEKFGHKEDRKILEIQYSEMEKLCSEDLRVLLTKAQKKGYPWGDIGVRIPYFTKLLSRGLGGSPSQVMTIERHRFNKSEYMALQDLEFTVTSNTFEKITGYFDLSLGVNPGEAISDFANRFLGGNYLGQGLVQEELMFHKTPILFITQLDQYIKGTPITLPGYDSVVIKGANQLWNIDMYGRNFSKDWESKITPNPIGPSKIVVFDALNLKRITIKGQPIRTTNYLIREVVWHIIKYYNTFDGAVKSGINKLHSGSIGAGVFGHTHAASFLMQMFALCLVNIKHKGPALTLILHTDPGGSTKAKQEQAYTNSMEILSSLNNTRSIKDALTEIIRIITTNEGGLYTVTRTR